MTKSKVVNVPDASPKRLLATWANIQDAWLRALAANTMLSRKPPVDDEVEVLYEILLAEKGFTKEPQRDVPMLELDDQAEDEDDSLELLSLEEVTGVNALAPGYPLEFDSGLTILFGQNGTGKTGYARVLKRLAAVRTAEPILPNAHAVGPQPSPSATIRYLLGSAEHEVRWHNEAGLAPFTRISVFDLPAATLHTDSDLNYVFTPAELALFSQVATGIRRVQERIAVEVDSLRPGPNPLAGQFARGTAVYPIVEGLGPLTDLAELEQLAAITDTAVDEQERLREEVSALGGGALDALFTTAQQRLTHLESLHSAATRTQAFSVDAYNVALKGLARAEVERRRAREELFSADELAGEPDDAWQRFVSAGDGYRIHLDLQGYPRQGDRCLYCRQALGPEALDLVQRYRNFLDESLVRRVTDAASQVDRLALRLDTYESSSLHGHLDSLLAADNEAHAKASLKKYRPIAARKEGRNVVKGLR